MVTDHPIRILLVEDDRAHAALIRRRLVAHEDEFTLEIAHSLAEAQALAAENPPDIAFVDYFLPDGNGLDLIAGAPAFPIIVLTSQGSEQLAVDAIKAGAQDYIVKSETAFADLPRMAHRALREWDNHLQRQRTEQELRASEARFRTMLEAVSEGILLVNRQGQIVLANQYATDMFHAGTGSLVGQPVDSLLPQAVQTAHGGLRDDYMLQPVTRPLGSGLDVVAQRPDGSTFPVEISLTPLIVDGEAVVMCFIVDITARKQLEEQRIYARALEVELEKEREIIELRERFTSMVSHEFRTPLAIIQAAAQLLRSYHSKIPPERLLEQIERIGGQADRILALLDDVLVLNRANAGKLEFHPEPLDVVAYCRHLVDEFRLASQNTHQVEMTFDPLPDEILIDPHLFSRMIHNLLLNAAKYSPAGSTICVFVHRDEEWLKVAISDQGIGIPVEEQQRIFEPFHRAPNAARTPGTGLGLAIVNRNVAAHGGTVTLHSTPGEGATFTVRLPLRTIPPVASE
jgi:PAS domain S-box-containing protein